MERLKNMCKRKKKEKKARWWMRRKKLKNYKRINVETEEEIKAKEAK